MRNIFDVTIAETLAVEGLQEFAGSTDTLESGFEDVLGLASVSMISGVVSVKLDWSGR